jgi:hypothetical protein
MNAKRRALLGSQHSRQSTILPHGMNRVAKATSFTYAVSQRLWPITALSVSCQREWSSMYAGTSARNIGGHKELTLGSISHT